MSAKQASRKSTSSSNGFYSGGAVGRDRHHWHFGRAAAGDSSRPRVGPPFAMHEQSEEHRAGGAQFYGQSLKFSHGRTMLQSTRSF